MRTATSATGHGLILLQLALWSTDTCGPSGLISLCLTLVFTRSEEGFPTSRALPFSFIAAFLTVVQDTEMSGFAQFSVFSALIPIKQYCYTVVSSEQGSISSYEYYYHIDSDEKNYIRVYVIGFWFLNLLLTAVITCHVNQRVGNLIQKRWGQKAVRTCARQKL